MNIKLRCVLEMRLAHDHNQVNMCYKRRLDTDGDILHTVEVSLCQEN